MKKTIAILLALLLCLVSASAWAEETDLKVTGTGVISVLADQVSVTLGVTETNEDVKTAQETVNAKINAICDALIAAGVEKKNIGTDRISIYAEYSDSSILRNGGELTGYTASNTITIQSRDIDQVGTYIDLAFEAGANTLESIDFSSSDTEQAKLDALKLAVENARGKADAIAEALGMQVGSVVQVTENGSYSYGAYASGAKMMNSRLEPADAATVLHAATLQVQAQVEIEFELIGK